MSRFNSTIRLKTQICIRCGKPCYWFSRKRCEQCARIENALSNMARETDEYIASENLQDLIRDADYVFSRWLRMSSADGSGNVLCYTCDAIGPWQSMDCRHFIKRECLYLRWDPRNCRVQNKHCNQALRGNLVEFRQRLEKEQPGITEILESEARTVYKPTRTEIAEVIAEYSHKIKQIA